MVAEILKHLTQSEGLHTRAQVLGTPSCVPQSAGFYGWYFRELPDDVPSMGCAVQDGATLLYVGIAPRSPSSQRTLRSRLVEHMRGNASGSTLRLSMGCLLASRLGLELRRTSPLGRRLTFGPGERILSDWFEKNARVAFHAVQNPWQLEPEIISALSLPLNLEHNEGHDFSRVLSRRRSEAKKRAAALPSWAI